jgi:hypothetical protein
LARTFAEAVRRMAHRRCTVAEMISPSAWHTESSDPGEHDPCDLRRRPSRTSQTHSGSAATIQWFAPVNRRNGEANVSHRFSVIKLHALELVDRHSPVAPGGIINQNAVPHYAPKYDEVIVAQGVDCHHERRPLYQVVQIELTQTPIKSPPR